MSWLDRLEKARVEAVAPRVNVWQLRLGRVRGKIDYDGLERVSTQTLLDLLEVPQSQRRVGTYRRLARVMTELGWRAVRVRDLTAGGYTEQVRGFCRDARAGRRSSAPNRYRPPKARAA
jgi:hypothetical protein